jgi:hypothetical protein
MKAEEMTGWARASAKSAPALTHPLEIDRTDFHISSARRLRLYDRNQEQNQNQRSLPQKDPHPASGLSFDWKRLNAEVRGRPLITKCAMNGEHEVLPLQPTLTTMKPS